MISEAIKLSLAVSAASTGLAMLVGMPAGWLLSRRRFPGRPIAEGLLTLPLVLPPTVLGYYLLVVMGNGSPFGRAYASLTGGPLVFSFAGIVVAAALGSLPLVVRQSQVAFASVDRDLEDAAQVCGASKWEVYWRITLPLARRGVIAGTALAAARAMGDFGATLMVGGNIPGSTRTLALEVYSAWQAGDDSTAQGLSLLMVGLGIMVAVLASSLTRKEDEQV